MKFIIILKYFEIKRKVVIMLIIQNSAIDFSFENKNKDIFVGSINKLTAQLDKARPWSVLFVLY